MSRIGRGQHGNRELNMGIIRSRPERETRSLLSMKLCVRGEFTYQLFTDWKEARRFGLGRMQGSCDNEGTNLA